MAKTKTHKNSFLKPKRRLAPRTTLAVVGAALCLFAVGFFASRQAHPASAQLGRILCNYGDANGVKCLNRYQGRTGYDVPVIGYYKDFDVNENYSFDMLNNMCNGGYVSHTCPFTVGLGLNDRYYGDEVVQIRDNATGKCLGAYTFDTTEGAEEKCNDTYGRNGGTGTVFVYNIDGGGGTSHYVESRYWSNKYGKPAWLCSDGYPGDARFVKLNVTFLTSTYANNCLWHYVNL